MTSSSVNIPDSPAVDSSQDGQFVSAGALFNKFKKSKLQLTQPEHSGASACLDVCPLSSSAPTASTSKPTKSNTVITQAITNKGKQVASGGPGGHAVRVSWRQKGNPVLSFVRNVAWQYDDIRMDYDCGSGCGMLYLSIKFHKRYPDYVYERIKYVGDRYILKVLLLLIDAEGYSSSLRELNRTCVQSGWTLVMAHSVEEVAEYIEAYKIYEHKPADVLRAPAPLNNGKDSKMQLGEVEYEQVIQMLTCVRSVNKSDAARLIDMFSSVRKITSASVEQLSLCPGMGPAKANRLYHAFRQPFRE